jgi:hypothetical protein
VIVKKQLENVEYLKYLGSMLTNDVGCRRENKFRIPMAAAAFNKKKVSFPSKLDLNLRKKLVNCYIWNIAFYGADTWTVQKLDQIPVKF